MSGWRSLIPGVVYDQSRHQKIHTGEAPKNSPSLNNPEEQHRHRLTDFLSLCILSLYQSLHHVISIDIRKYTLCKIALNINLTHK